MPRRRGKDKRKEQFPAARARTSTTTEAADDDLTPFQRVVGAKHTMFKHNHEQILCMLSGLASSLSEMNPLITEPDMPIGEEMKRLRLSLAPGSDADSLTNIQRIGLDKELCKQSRILSTLTGVVSEMREMKRLLITEPPETIRIFSDELQQNIMRRLPVDSLARSRCVSKTWKSWIDSSTFIAAHIRMNQQPKHHLLVAYQERECEDASYVSFADDDSFPHLRFFPALPPSLRSPSIVGASYGLFCLECTDSYYKDMAVIWNPCIRKAIAIYVPEEFDENTTVVGFGVCPVTLDPKILHITHLCPPQARTRKTKKFGQFWKVAVYRLSSGNFTTLSRTSSNLPSVSIQIQIRSTPVVVDRLIYWCADFDRQDGTSHNMIMTFDITDENFQEVQLPSRLARLRPDDLSLSKLRDSLVILQRNEKRHSCHVWKMDHGLFTKLFTINSPPESIMLRAAGFRNTGAPIISVEASSNLHHFTQLVCGAPNSNKHRNLLLRSHADTYIVESYMETLLLIGSPASMSY